MILPKDEDAFVAALKNIVVNKEFQEVLSTVQRFPNWAGSACPIIIFRKR